MLWLPISVYTENYWIVPFNIVNFRVSETCVNKADRTSSHAISSSQFRRSAFWHGWLDCSRRAGGVGCVSPGAQSALSSSFQSLAESSIFQVQNWGPVRLLAAGRGLPATSGSSCFPVVWPAAFSDQQWCSMEYFLGYQGGKTLLVKGSHDSMSFCLGPPTGYLRF